MVWLLLVALVWVAAVLPAGYLFARRLRRLDASAEARRLGVVAASPLRRQATSRTGAASVG